MSLKRVLWQVAMTLLVLGGWLGAIIWFAALLQWAGAAGWPLLVLTLVLTAGAAAITVAAGWASRRLETWRP